jgi:hypothetical protein
LAFQDGEEHLDEVQPGGIGRGEVQLDPWVAGQPGLDPLVLVGGVLVQHHMELPAGVGAGDQLEEGQELAVAVVRLQGVGHPTGGDLQSGEQGGGAVADIVVGAPLDPGRRRRPDRLGALQRLDLRLLIHADHDRVRGWVQRGCCGACTHWGRARARNGRDRVG